VPPSTNTDRVIIFDGIEFNDNLRWIDVMSEGLHPARPMPTCEDWRRPSCIPVIVDATFLKRGQRESFPTLARETL